MTMICNTMNCTFFNALYHNILIVIARLHSTSILSNDLYFTVLSLLHWIVLYYKVLYCIVLYNVYYSVCYYIVHTSSEVASNISSGPKKLEYTMINYRFSGNQKYKKTNFSPSTF